MASSSDESNQLQPSPSFTPVVQQKPATVSVKAASGVLTDIGESAVTRRAEYIRQSTDEEMIWQESPSLALLAPRFLRYAILMAIVFIACSAVKSLVGQNPAAQAALESRGIHATDLRSTAAGRKAGHKRGGRHALDDSADAASTDGTAAATDSDLPQPRPAPQLDRILTLIRGAFAGLFVILFLAYLVKLKSTKYCASSQRLIVEEGSWHSVNRPYELHQLGDAVILKPMLLRMFGVSNLVIMQPHIELYGLRNAEYVRDILRQGGQLEAQRVDKIRWR